MSIVEITVTIQGLDRIVSALGQSIKPTIQGITVGVGEVARSYMAKYPGPSAQPVTWQSRKQRIHYIIMRREAGLPLKYTRGSDPMSQHLGQSWEVKPAGDLNAVLGTTVTYGPFVQGQLFQQAQHFVTGWTTDELVKRDVEASGDIDRVMQQGMDGFFVGAAW